MITFEKVSKTYAGGVQAVRELSLEVQEGETVVLLGTSGSGKTTTLKMVNRLIEPSGGRILIDQTDIMDQNPIELRRSIGYAIQHIGLFPHMTIGENIAVVPKLVGWAGEDIAERVDKLLAMVGLEPEQFRDRYPNQLSGGQRQRVGVARSLAADPPIVLMDEPFGALDPITREQLQGEFIELESQIQKTILFVTHDVFEAVRMGDRIALLDEGRLQQLATPADLVESPANEFVDHFLGQHRFQLSLLTRTIESVVSRKEGKEEGKAVAELPEPRLSALSPLIDGLDAFKRSGAERLPVFKGKQRIGQLTKQRLVDEIAAVFGETAEEGERPAPARQAREEGEGTP
ncbi:MAG: ABC transporter ATP-binding protein [Candidatus Brocadiia bacterium]